MTRAILAGMGVGTAALAQPPLFDGELLSSIYFEYAVGIDVDGDGQEDLLCAAFDEIAAHLTGDDGRPTPAIVTTAIGSMREFAAADLSGDGVPDVAYTLGTGVVIHIGVGDGTFGDGELMAFESVSGLAAIDADLDGDVDLAVGVGANVEMLINDGAGGFESGTTTQVPGTAFKISVGDINGDGIDDLGVLQFGGPDSYTLSSPSGDGAGGYSVTSSRQVPQWSPDFTLADMNSDGMQDGVVARFTDEDEGFIDVFAGTQGGFDEAISSALISDNGVSLSTLDADGDGNLDVVFSGGQAWELLRGDGTGALETMVLEAPSAPFDGGSALIETNAGTVLGLSRGTDLEVRTRGDGVIGTRIIETGGETQALAIGDVGADGDADIVLGTGFNQSQLVIYAQDNGEFSEAVVYDVQDYPWIMEIAIGDVTGDGVADIVVAHDGTQGLYLLEGVSLGAPLPPVAITDLRFGSSISLADWDDDGELDLITFGSFFNYGLDYGPGVFLNEAGRFELEVIGNDFQLGFGNGQARAADYNGDGTLDLLAAQGGTFFYGEDEGDLFVSMEAVSVSGSGTDMVVADLNGDGLPDAVRAGFSGVSILFNVAGEFEDETFIGDERRGDLLFADFDADGDMDIAATGEFSQFGGSEDVDLFTNEGGVFAASRFGASSETVVIAEGDLDGDGDTDLVTATIQPNNDAPQVMMIHENLLSCPADFNGDGVVNVLDFMAFQLAWQAQNPAADCNLDGGFDVLDFVCFQLLFVEGCN